ncbi:MAG: VWA domain-containing protein, partial [Bacteroidota bacterium]
DLLGRLRQAEVETEEEAYERVLVYQAWVDDPMQRSEVVGITTGNELNSLVSSEVALLSDAETEAAFLKKYADHDLLVKQYRDQRLERRAEIHSESEQRVKLKEKGPFIICVDTSGSMEGEPERIAKAMCFAILKMASRENRSAFLINFSSGVQTIDLTDLSQSIDAIARFLQLSFHGGTDISLALHEALKQLQEHQYRDADVLVVSDFIMYKVEPDILQGMGYQQHHHGTQFHNLIISDQANLKVIEQFDHNWIYDPQEKGVIKQLYQELRQLMARPI